MGGVKNPLFRYDATLQDIHYRIELATSITDWGRDSGFFSFARCADAITVPRAYNGNTRIHQVSMGGSNSES